MTHKEVLQMLVELDIPFAYDHFAEGEAPDPPFICFLFPGSENFSGINRRYGLNLKNYMKCCTR